MQWYPLPGRGLYSPFPLLLLTHRTEVGHVAHLFFYHVFAVEAMLQEQSLLLRVLYKYEAE